MSRSVLSLAVALLPPSRKAWGAAMVAEHAALSSDQGAFAWGCLGASLKENLTTGEGWARIGFLLPLMFAGFLGWSALQSGLNLLTNPSEVDRHSTLAIMVIVGLGAISIVIGLTALKAMSAPTNRLHLASVGTACVSAVCYVVGGMLVSGFTTVMIGWFADGGKTFTPGIIWTVNLVYGIVFIAIGYFATRNAKALRNAGFAATFAHLVMLAILYLGTPMKEYFFVGIFQSGVVLAVFMVVLALSGSLLMGMQKPPKTN